MSALALLLVVAATLVPTSRVRAEGGLPGRYGAVLALADPPAPAAGADAAPAAALATDTPAPVAPGPRVDDAPEPDANATGPRLVPLPDDVVGKPVTAFRFKLQGMDEREREQLEGYLEDERKKPMTPELMVRIASRIIDVRRYAKARCTGRPNGLVLCSVARARILHEVDVEGLPLSLLESDLRKRIFLRPGEPIDEDDSSGKSRLVRQRTRIEEFLASEGFHGAEVRVLVKKGAVHGEFNVVVRVGGGAFVHVNRVDIKRFGPLSQRDLIESFGRMCFTGEGLLDGVFVANIFSCFNKRRLSATIEHFTQELHAAGYPEARLRVDTSFVDPRHTDEPACTWPADEMDKLDKQDLKPPPACVNLTIDVEAGTQVTARFHVGKDERPIVETPAVVGTTLLWARETISEPVSRLVQIVSRAPPDAAIDTELVEGRLRESLSFEEAGAVDETEVGVTVQRAEEYLASRGRIAPHFDVEDQTYGKERVFDFYARKSPVAAVRSVRFSGNRALSDDDIVKNTELAARPRSLRSTGAVSFAQLADDEQRIRDLYADHGYPEADVQTKAEVSPGGAIDVSFVIDEGAPFVLAGLVLAGGAPELTPDVLKAIKHCQGGAAARKKLAPMRPEDCEGAPLRPDELEADAQRVEGVYAGHGFPNVNVDVETAFSAEGTTVRITVAPLGATEAEREHAQPHNVRQVRLGEVFLEGNRLTQRDVLLREAGLDNAEDLPLDPVALGKGISRLRRSGLYDSVDLQYLGLDGSSDHAHVRLAVAERPAFTLDTSIGFSTEQLLSLRTEIRHKNVFGTMLDAGWLLDFGLFLGRFSQTRAQVRWPRIYGSDVSASFVPIAMSYLDEPAGARLLTPASLASQKASAAWELRDFRRRLFSVGASLSLDWRVRDFWQPIDDKLTVGAAIELRYDFFQASGAPVGFLSKEALTTVDGLALALKEAPSQIAALTPRISYNGVDNPFDPTTGFGVDLFLRGSTPPLVKADGPFGVLGLAARGYWTPWERLTLAAGGRARLGAATPDHRCPSDPKNQDHLCEWALMQSDLLLLGGERSVRGVLLNTIGVRGTAYTPALVPVKDAHGVDVVQPHPGFYDATGTLEARFTLVRHLLIGDLKPALFVDGGFSTNDFAPYVSSGNDFDSRSAWSVGAGLRYVTVVGPVAFDFAYSPPRNTSAISVTLGYVF